MKFINNFHKKIHFRWLTGLLIVCLLCPITPPSPFFERWLYCSNFKSATTGLKYPKLLLIRYPSGRFFFANWYYQFTEHSFLQQTFQRCFNVALWLIRRRDAGLRQINIETKFCISTANQRCLFYETYIKQQETTLKERWSFKSGVSISSSTLKRSCENDHFRKDLLIYWTQVYSEPSQTSKVELFAKAVNDWKSLTTFRKSFILDGWQGSEYGSAEYKVNCLPRLLYVENITCLK